MQVNVFFHSHTMEKHVLVQLVVTWIMPVKELGALRKLMPMAIILVEIMVIVQEQHVGQVSAICMCPLYKLTFHAIRTCGDKEIENLKFNLV